MANRIFGSTVTAIAVLALIGGCSTNRTADESTLTQGAKVDRESVGGSAAAAKLARSKVPNFPSTRNLQTVALFNGAMPTGVTVSKSGRIFVCFPRWGDPVEFTVGELRGDDVVAYPDAAANKLNMDSQANGLISVQSVVIDPQDRLWLLDTGSIAMGPIKPGAAKLLCYDLKTNQMVKRISFPSDVALPTTYLNDVRFNMSMGKEGVAFISDSSDQGPNGFIVVDLASGTSWRKLNDHPSTKADQNFVPNVEGEPMMIRPGTGKPDTFLRIGVDGIALSNDGKTLYYCPLASRRLYSVSTAALADGGMSDEDTARTIEFLGNRDFASDGLLCDDAGNLLLTDYERNAIRKRTTRKEGDAAYETVAQDGRLIWPDTLSIDPDGGSLYVIANQLNRQAKFHEGRDLRQQPYVLFRVRLGDRHRQVAGPE